MNALPPARRRWLKAALVLSVLPLAAVSPTPVGAQSTSDAHLTQDGWWSRLQGPIDAGPVQEPANPLRDSVNPQTPQSPTVPANSIAVSASAEQPLAVAAVGFTFAATEGATVNRLLLTMKESPQAGANQNASGAKIAACPIINFWAGVDNGAWQNRPAFECADPGAVEGVRADDGTWTFDLTRLGQSYANGQLEPNGVALVPAEGAAGGFQVSFLDISTGAPTLAASVTPAPTFDAPPATDPVPEPSFEPAPSDFGSPVEAPLSADLPAVEPPPQPLADAQPPAPATEVAAEPVVADPAGLGDLPWGALLLIPLALGAAGATAYALGPAGRPDPTRVRAGGVSRTLAARRLAGQES